MSYKRQSPKELSGNFFDEKNSSLFVKADVTKVPRIYYFYKKVA
jgi:hypothetical protein